MCVSLHHVFINVSCLCVSYCLYKCHIMYSCTHVCVLISCLHSVSCVVSMCVTSRILVSCFCVISCLSVSLMICHASCNLLDAELSLGLHPSPFLDPGRPPGAGLKRRENKSMEVYGIPILGKIPPLHGLLVTTKGDRVSGVRLYHGLILHTIICDFAY